MGSDHCSLSFSPHYQIMYPYQTKQRERAVGFFHPYTNDGGGRERVLWCAVKAIQEETSHLDLDCVIYTGDHDASPHSLMARALDRFGVKLIHPPKVLSLSLSGISEIADWILDFI